MRLRKENPEMDKADFDAIIGFATNAARVLAERNN